MRIHIHHTVNLNPCSELKIEVLPYYPPAPRGENPPSRFRCFVCWEVKSGSHFAGKLWDGRNICRECFPYVTEWGVGCLVKADRRMGLEKADPSPKAARRKCWKPPKKLLRKIRRSAEKERKINNRLGKK